MSRPLRRQALLRVTLPALEDLLELAPGIRINQIGEEEDLHRHGTFLLLIEDTAGERLEAVPEGAHLMVVDRDRVRRELDLRWPREITHGTDPGSPLDEPLIPWRTWLNHLDGIDDIPSGSQPSWRRGIWA